MGTPAPFFFDSEQTSINKDLNRQTFDGNVVVIGGGTMISADRLSFDRTKQRLIASGHITVLHVANGSFANPQALGSLSGMVFTGDTLDYRLGTGDFVLTQSVMVAQDPSRIENVVKSIFGFSINEIKFEIERQKRLSENSQKKSLLRAEAITLYKQKRQQLPEALVDKYAVLLEQGDLIKDQENPSLAQLDPDRRASIKRRREYWEASRVSPLKQQRFASQHFRIEGENLVRVNDADYLALNALITPCRCDEDEEPAWAFRAGRIEAQMGGYADLTHPILEIKGIPVLYLPRLSLPLKDERQSGFLLPSMGFEARSGNVFSQPFYMVLDANKDATVTTDIFERRGTRLGLEYRLQQREFAGWNLKVEGIRDQLWLKDRALRQDLKTMYQEGLDYALKNPLPPTDVDLSKLQPKDYARYTLLDREHWEKNILGTPLTPESAASYRQLIDRQLAIPDNAWRGSFSWNGVSFLSPRLSIVSAGQVNSDHRYIEDLYVPANYQEAFFGGRDSRAVTPARIQVHADGKDFYAGVGSTLGDHHLLPHRFEGQQMPQRFKIQSRALSFLPESSPLPAYGQISFESIGIREYRPPLEAMEVTPALPPVAAETSLGDGRWQRIKLEQVTPLYPDGIFQIFQFADGEQRMISHQKLVEKNSSSRSYRLGVEFRLPIDGKGILPQSLQDKQDPLAPYQTSSLKYIHHLMDWRLRFSTRPAVVKEGLYTDEARAAEGGDLAYFASDRVVNPNSSIDNDVPEEERMKIHRRVTLSTEHLVRFFNRSWTPVGAPAASRQVLGQDVSRRAAQIAGTPHIPTPDEAPEKSAPQELGALESSQERARKELLQGLGLPIQNPDAMINRATGQWGIERFQRSDEIYASPVTFRANIAYDFMDAEEREKQRQSRRLLDEELASLEANPAADQNQIQALKTRKQTEVFAEPWKNPDFYLEVNHLGYTLSSTAVYSIYLRTATTFTAGLGLPPFWGTSLGFGYSLGKEYQQQEKDFKVTTQRTMSLASALSPYLSANIALGRQLIEGQPESFTNNIRVATGLAYTSPSQCWGLQALRVKEYGNEERDASYTLQLSMVFMGQQRTLPNMSPGIIREIREEPQS
jgi:hypothetical protein